MKILFITISLFALVACSTIQKKYFNTESCVVKVDIKCFNDTVHFENDTDLSKSEIKNLATKIALKTKNIARNKGVVFFIIDENGVPSIQVDATGYPVKIMGPCGLQDAPAKHLILCSTIRPLSFQVNKLPVDTVLVSLESIGYKYPHQIEYRINSYGKFVLDELVEFKISCKPEHRN